MSAEVSLRLSLLDAQVVDCDRLPIGRIDDVELELSSDGASLEVTALLTGAEALGTRIGGLIGRAMAAPAARLRSRAQPPGPVRLDPALVEELQPLVRLSVAFEDLPHVGSLEHWLARHVVERLPGTGHEGK